MKYRDLREFLAMLEGRGELRRITAPVSPRLEMTEVCDRTLRAGGPALLFENPTGHSVPVLANLFGTEQRVALGMGQDSLDALRGVGDILAYLRQPDPPAGLRDALGKVPLLRQVLNMNPRQVRGAPCQQRVVEGADVDLAALPIQTCWPEDAGPLVTWPLVITRGPGGSGGSGGPGGSSGLGGSSGSGGSGDLGGSSGLGKQRQNLGIYRMQVAGRNRLIMRWLPHRGGALDFRDWTQAHPGQPYPVAVALGADPATTLGAVTPVPDSLSEYAFAGLLRGARTEVTPCLSPLCRDHGLQVPATAEYILEGHIKPGDTAPEGPFGDHTGYYNEVETFPVFTIDTITHREQPIYHSTYTGRPPDEPSVLGAALNEVFIPILQRQFPEIADFYLPPEGCSYRLAVITLRKQYPGHAKRVMMGAWSFLRQFTYTKFLIVTDDDVNARDWKDVIWALTTRMDPRRDSVFIDNTPIDYLDFASPVAGLGSKVGFDATAKWPGETERSWGRPIAMDPAVVRRIDEIWEGLGIGH